MLTLVLWLTAGSEAAEDRSWSFPSGLRVLIYSDDRFPVVHAALVVGTGNVDAPAERPDLPHIVEHVAFRGRSGDATLEDRLNALGCDHNGHTEPELTTYEASCPKRSSEDQVAALLSILDGGFAGIDANDVTLETRIVEHEYAFREGSPLPLYNAALQALYGPDHPYGIGVLPPPGAAPASLEAVTAFVAEHYRADVAVLSVVGDVDFAAVGRALAAHPKLVHPGLEPSDVRTFPAKEVSFLGYQADGPWYADPDHPERALAFASSPEPRYAHADPPQAPAVPLSTITAPILSSAVVVSWALPGVDFDNYFAEADLEPVASAEVADAVGRDVRASCSFGAGRTASTLSCIAYFDDAARTDTVRKQLVGAFERPWTWLLTDRVIGHGGHPSASFQVSEREAGGIDTALAAGEHLVLTDLSAYFSVKYGSQGAFDEASYLAVRDRWLGADRASVLLVTPGAGAGDDDPTAGTIAAPRGGTVAASAVDPDGPVVSAVVGARKTTAFDNGFRAVQIPVEAPWASYLLLFRQPDDYPADLAALVDPALVTPRKFHGRKLDWPFLPVGVSGQDYTWGGYTRLPVGFNDLVEEVMLGMRATFDPAQARKISPARIDARLAGAARSWRTPSYWLAQRLTELLVGDGTPLGMIPADRDRYAAMTADDVAAYMTAKFRPDNAELVIAGARPDPALDAELVKRFGAWPVPAEPRPAATTGNAFPTPPPTTLVAAPVEPSHTAMLQLSCPIDLRGRAPGERYAIGAVVELLLSDAAFRSVRDDSGAAYAVYADVFDHTVSHGPIARLTTWSSPADAGKAHAALRQVVAAAAAWPDDASLAAIRQRVLDGHRVRVDTMRSAADLVEKLDGRGIGVDVQDHLGELLAGVGPDDLATALATCDDHAFVGIVGDPATVGPALEAAGIAWSPLDWRALEDARIAELPPAIAKTEREWLAR
jgi:predicted Zn-dependent peptidase